MFNPLKPSVKALIETRANRINKKIKSNPILFASFFACIKNSVADFTIQKLETPHPKESFIFKRNIAFSLFGFFHVGAGQYIILNKIIPRIIPALNNTPIKTIPTLNI